MQIQTITKGLAAFVLLAALGVAVTLGYRHLEDEHVGLVGTARERLAKSAVQDCAIRQGGPGISRPLLTAFCRCYANELTDTLSNNDVEALGMSDPELSLPVQPKIAAAAEACRDRFRKTGHF